MRKHSNNILIYRLGSLGDTVMALPCFHKVRETFPDAHITLLTNRPIMAKAAPLAAVLGSDYFFDQILAYPVGTRNPLVLANLLKQIRALNIDTVVNLTGARSKKSVMRDRWFFRVAGASQLIGFPRVKEDFEVCVDAATGDFEWEAKRLARRIEPLGKIPLEEDHYWDMRLTNEELRAADQILSGTFSNMPIIVVCAGTKMQAKDWGTENWLNLVQRLQPVLSEWKLVVIGAAEEAKFADSLLKTWHGIGINLCGKTSPRVSAAVLQQASIFVGHDSGPMHLAACVGTPCVAIFAARNLPRQWYPRGNYNRILYHKTTCAGCGLEICIDEQKKCILSITVDEVQQAVMEMVRNSVRID